MTKLQAVTIPKPVTASTPETTADAAPLLRVDGLAVDFLTRAGPVHAVRGIDFSVGVGETIGIVGESGSGKSATALCRSCACCRPTVA